MENFDLQKFETNLITAVTEGGHNMDMLLVLSQLLMEEDVKAFFSDKNVDVPKLKIMLKKEINQRIEEKDRRDEHVVETRNSEGYEFNQHKSNQNYHMKERVHALIDAVELRKVADGKDEVTAVDVLKEALTTTLLEATADINPAKAMVGSLTGIGGAEYAGVKTLEILDIKPFELFPDLKEKVESTIKKHVSKMGETTAEFLTAVLAGIEKQKPGAIAAIAGALTGNKKDHPRIS